MFLEGFHYVRISNSLDKVLSELIGTICSHSQAFPKPMETEDILYLKSNVLDLICELTFNYCLTDLSFIEKHFVSCCLSFHLITYAVKPT